MKCFVTGAGGFVGPHLVRHLVREGARVQGIFSRSKASPDGKLAACDLADFDRLAKLLKEAEPDCVFHLAAFSNPARSFLRPRDCYLANLQGTLNLLEAVRIACPQARVLLISTAQVYSPDDRPLREDSQVDPANPYAASKSMAESLAGHYLRDFGLDVVVARPFNHSGPGQSPDFVVSDFCRQIAQLEGRNRKEGVPAAVLRVGNLDPVRDFLDVRDVASAYWELALKGRKGEAYNVCSGQGRSIRSVLEAALSIARTPIAWRSDAAKSGRAGHLSFVGCHSKLCSETAWHSRISFEIMISDTLEYWRNHP